jgi:hypothetical protein
LVLKETEEVERLTGKYTTFEVPPPGAGLTTVIEAVRGVAMSEARMPALSRELLTKVVVRWLPFHFKIAPVTKPVPLTVSVKAEWPGAIESGTSGWLMEGIGFCAAQTPVTVANKKGNATTMKMSTLILVQDSRFLFAIGTSLQHQWITGRNEKKGVKKLTEKSPSLRCRIVSGPKHLASHRGDE